MNYTLLEHHLRETYAEMLYVYHLYHEKILSPQWVEMSDDRQPWLDRAEKELRDAGLISPHASFLHIEQHSDPVGPHASQPESSLCRDQLRLKVLCLFLCLLGFPAAFCIFL